MHIYQTERNFPVLPLQDKIRGTHGLFEGANGAALQQELKGKKRGKTSLGSSIFGTTYAYLEMTKGEGKGRRVSIGR